MHEQEFSFLHTMLLDSQVLGLNKNELTFQMNAIYNSYLKWEYNFNEIEPVAKHIIEQTKKILCCHFNLYNIKKKLKLKN